MTWMGAFAFCAHFILRQNDAVLDGKLIYLWTENFRITGSSIKKKSLRRIKVCYLSKNGKNTTRHYSWGLSTFKNIASPSSDHD